VACYLYHTGWVARCACIPVSDVVGTAVDIASTIEARRLAVKRQLADAAAEAAHVPRTMKASHFEQMTLFNRLLAAEANVAGHFRRYDVIVVNALNRPPTTQTVSRAAF